jgi:CBS domain-containing protein
LSGGLVSPETPTQGPQNERLGQEDRMKVSEAMTHDVFVVAPDETLQKAARVMAGMDAGALPVAENDRLVGIVTDRDIAVRGIAEGHGPEAAVREIMSTEIKYCFEDQEVDEVARNMADIQVRRLPVVDRNKRLVGILSLGDIAVSGDGNAGAAPSGISQPGGQHNQAR